MSDLWEIPREIKLGPGERRRSGRSRRRTIANILFALDPFIPHQDSVCTILKFIVRLQDHVTWVW